MTEKQKIFADEYLIDLNATRAYKAAYPTVRKAETAAASATRLLRNVKVAEYIHKCMDERKKRTEITQDMVVNELALIAFSNATDYAHVIEREATIEINGKLQPLLDKEGNPVKYRTIEPVLTKELTEEQTKVISVMKKGRDGFEVRPYDKTRALELLGRHLGMFSDKMELSGDMELKVVIDYGNTEGN